MAEEMLVEHVTRVLRPQSGQLAPTRLEPLYQRWYGSQLFVRFGAALDRAAHVGALGLVGPGDVIGGAMVLMDCESLELVRAQPGARIEEDRVYVNARNLPDWLLELAHDDPQSKPAGQEPA